MELETRETIVDDSRVEEVVESSNNDNPERGTDDALDVTEGPSEITVLDAGIEEGSSGNVDKPDDSEIMAEIDSVGITLSCNDSIDGNISEDFATFEDRYGGAE